MQGWHLLEICPYTTFGPTGAQNAFGLTRLAPGDVIQARILSVSPEGRTHLQIGASQFSTNQPLGGKPGDILFFEVQPRLPAGEIPGQVKSPILIRLLAGSRQANKLPGEMSSATPGQAPTGSSARPAVAAPLQSMTGGSQSNSQNPVMLALTAMQRQGRSSSPNARFSDKDRRRSATSVRRSNALDPSSAVTQTSSHKRADAGAGAANKPNADFREAAAPPDYASGFLIEAAGEEYRSAHIRMHSRKAIRTAGGQGDFLSAALMLDLEKTGPLEVEVQMLEDQIWVKFSVATETVRKEVQARLGEMHAALKDLAEKVYCRVQVDPEGETMDARARIASQEIKAIDFII